MAVSRTNLSTNLDYVSWSSGDTAKDIFNSLGTCLTNHGWTQASNTSGTFFDTYDPNGASSSNDLRRVYYAALSNTGSGLTNKYVMLRIVKIEAASSQTVYQYLTNTWFVQLIPFQAWSGDTGTNPAGASLSTTYNANGTYDNHNWNNVTSNYYNQQAPYTWFATSVGGYMYVNASAKWICMWPYFVSGTVYNGARNQVLMYGEMAEDFAAYTNVPPVYVTTLQRLLSAAGNSNTPARYNNGYSTSSYGYLSPQFLMPCVPASTTGYTGIANTVRTGYNAHACTRVMMGHYGFFGYDGQALYNGQSAYSSYYSGTSAAEYVRGQFIPMFWYPYSTTYMKMSKYNHNASPDPASGSYPDTSTNQNSYANSTQQPALNSTNLKGIEPILGGGALGSGYSGYNSNPYPMYWLLGRMYGLKFVGAAATGSWSTLDKVSMNTDSDYFYVKSGGSSKDFVLIGALPASEAGGDPGAPTVFFALPA